MTAQLERLAAARIQLLPLTGIATHFVFERDGFAALVERRKEAFGNIGSSGKLSGRGLAVLVWRGSEGYFVTKGCEQRAEPGEIDALRQFAADLENALQSR